MKAEWQMKKLGEVCQIKPPKKEAKKALTDDAMVSFVPMENLGIGQKEFDSSQIRRLDEVAGNYTYFANEDVLLAKITPCFENGKLGIARNLKNGIGFGSSEYIVFRTSKDLLNEYLYYFLASPRFRVDGASRMTGAVGHKRVPMHFIENTQIPLPSVREQQRIVTILDQVFEGIATATANAEKNLANARGLFDSMLQSIFAFKGDEWLDTTIGEQIRFIDYRGKTPMKTENGLRLITAKNVKMGFLQDEPMEYVSPDTYDTWMTRGIPRCGDVLFTTEAPLANVAQLDTDARVVFAQRIIIMRSDPSTLDSTFLKYMLLSQPVQQRIHAKGTGATVKGIKASLLRTVQIRFPKSVAEQQAIVAMLDELSAETKKLEAIYQQKLIALNELKKFILNQAFSGQLH